VSPPHLAVGAGLLACGLAILVQTHFWWHSHPPGSPVTARNLWRLWYRVWGVAMVVTAVLIMTGLVELNLATRVAVVEVVGWIFADVGIQLALAVWRRVKRK